MVGEADVTRQYLAPDLFWIVATTSVGVGILITAVIADEQGRWPAVAVAIAVQFGVGLTVLAGFFFVQRGLFTSGPTKRRRGVPDPPRPAWRRISTFFICGLALDASAVALALLTDVRDVLVAVLMEFGSSSALLAVIVVAERRLLRPLIDPTYKPERIGDLCYRAIPPSRTRRIFWLEGGVLECEHDPAHRYSEPIDLGLPDLRWRVLLLPEWCLRFARWLKRAFEAR